MILWIVGIWSALILLGFAMAVDFGLAPLLIAVFGLPTICLLIALLHG